jgi:hypothetical protein
MKEVILGLLLIAGLLHADVSKYEYERSNAAAKDAFDDMDCDFGDCPKPEPKPKVIIKEKVVEKIVEKPVVQEKIIIQEKIVEKPVERVIYRDRPQQAVQEAQPSPSGTYTSCLEIKQSNPGTQSGDYELNIGGRTYKTFCEMELEGGGWTRVWVAESHNYKTDVYDYDLPFSVIEASTRTMIAYDRNKKLYSPYSFVTPQEWKTQHPFTYNNKVIGISTFDVLTNKEYRNRRLFFGKDSYSSKCEHYFRDGNYGKICITDTEAPFYTGFNTSSNDYCNTSKQRYSQVPCDERRFSIFMK